MFVINYGSTNTAALQRINGNTYPSYEAAVEAITNCVDCEFPYDDPRHAEAIAEARDELRDCIYTCDNMAHMAELLNDIDAEINLGRSNRQDTAKTLLNTDKGLKQDQGLK